MLDKSGRTLQAIKRKSTSKAAGGRLAVVIPNSSAARFEIQFFTAGTFNSARTLFRPYMLRPAFVLLCLLSGLSAGTAAETPLRVGITYCEDHSGDTEIVANFDRILSQALPGVPLDVRRFEVHELEEWVKADTIDLFLANSSLYRTLINEGVKDIATAASPLFPNPNLGDGSVWIVRADNERVKSPSDFSGLRLITKGPDAHIWYFAAAELLDQGLDPEKTFSSVEHVGHNTEAVMLGVLAGKADVGVLPVCYAEEWLEQHPEEKGKIRFVDVHTQSPCVLSTRLYPNWTVGITASMPPDKAHAVASALLTAPKDENGISWSIATRFDTADNTLRELKVGQYRYLREWTLKRIVREYGVLIGAAAALVFALMVYAFYARKLIAARSRQLAESLRSQAQYHEQYRSAQASYDAMRRMGVLTQVSNVLAHEIRQPLNAVELFSHGLLRRLRSKPPEPEEVAAVVEKMREQARYADSIVTRVREFTKQGPHRRTRDLRDVIESTASHFILCSRSVDRIEKRTESVIISADPFELELLLINLLNNGSEALRVSGRTDPVLTISCRKEDDCALLEVTDNGREISAEELEKIRKAFYTTTIEGTGVGLSIVTEIAESYGGTLTFTARKSGGLEVTVRLPITQTPAQTEKSP